MLVKQWDLYDKTFWPSGPWHDETDKKQWPDPHTGLACLIVRNDVGCWCGYVGVPPGHKYFGVHYMSVPIHGVHGGLTFSDKCQEDGKICHEAEGEVWWLGFDCMHTNDHVPNHHAIGDPRPTQYRNQAFVEQECTDLARRLADVA